MVQPELITLLLYSFLFINQIEFLSFLRELSHAMLSWPTVIVLLDLLIPRANLATIKTLASVLYLLEGQNLVKSDEYLIQMI